MNLQLNNKVIIVTGGAKGIGEGICKVLANEGAIPVVVGRKASDNEAVVSAIVAAGGKAFQVAAELSEPHECKKAVDAVIEHFGRIDGLVNGAGGNMPGAVVKPGDDVFNLDIDAMRQVMDLNLYGTMIPTQIFGEAIAKTGKGSIVNISSMTSQRAVTRVLGYSMGKAAVDCYTKWFSVEMAKRYGDSIRMNAIAPGFFLTEQNRTLLTQPDGSYTDRGNAVIKQTPFNRFGDADELIGALIWLLSDASKFVTGTVVNIDGGFSVFSGV